MTETTNTPASGTKPNGQGGGEEFTYIPKDLVDWVESLVAMLESVDRHKTSTGAPSGGTTPKPSAGYVVCTSNGLVRR
jgi:hypothetical protein